MSGLQNNPILNRQPGQASFGDHLRALLDDHAMRSDKLIPASVVSFDRTKNIATVQPMVMLVDSQNQTRLRNQVAEVPVISLGGGGFHISFPLKAGDLGWILAADRDISLFMQNLSAAKPNTNRKNQFADSWFIPDVFRKYTINGDDEGAVVIQATDGSTRVAIGDGTVNITAPTSVKIDSPKTTITGDVMIEKTLQVMEMTNVYGGFSAYGFGGGAAVCTLPETTTIGGIVVYGHGHIENNTPGGRTSGGMIQ